MSALQPKLFYETKFVTKTFLKTIDYDFPVEGFNDIVAGHYAFQNTNDPYDVSI
jgi:hypothetical protein